MVHLLFEQSGTFRDEFRLLGFEACDYDIQNEYGKTDIVCDLFNAINDAHMGKSSTLDSIKSGELVFAFFPCTQFETQKTMIFRGCHYGVRKWSDLQKVEYCMAMHETLHKYYVLFCKLCALAIKRQWRLVIENPYSYDHYLKRYFPLCPSLIDRDRTRDGDYFKKPTQFWFIGFKPERNIIFEPMQPVRRRFVEKLSGGSKERSEIHHQYARRFIKQYILTDKSI